MKTLVLPGALLLVAVVAGCSAAGSSLAGVPAGGASAGEGGASAGAGGASGFGGSIAIFADAGVAIGNLSGTPPTYDWTTHTCIGCSAAGGALGSGGSIVTTDGGATSAGGSFAAGGATSMAGSAGMGGFPSAGGASASGGSTATSGSGGRGAADASAPPSDAPGASADASPDGPRPSDGPRAPEAGSPDASASPDARTTDAAQPDTSANCVAQILPIVPTSLEQLVPGVNTRIVLRAEIVSGGPPVGATWTWRGSLGANPSTAVNIPTAGLGQQDPATAAFDITAPGQYTFRVTDSTHACSATISQQFSDAETTCAECLSSVIVNATPPSTANVPAQTVYFDITNPPPQAGPLDIGLDPGVAVQISPSVGNSIVTSYVRITRFNQLSGELELVADGEEGSQGVASTAFSARLINSDGKDILSYNVLVVPLDGGSIGSAAVGTVDATAPQLFQNLTTSSFNATNAFSLSGAVAVTGSATSATSQGVQAVTDARVVLTSQDPTSPPSDPTSLLLFSSVGSTAAGSNDKGNYALNVQPGNNYWVSVWPPVGSGLAEALAPEPVAITGNTATIDFQWDPPSAATLTLNVVDADGMPVPGARVRVTSHQAPKVGTLTVQNAGGAPTTEDAYANVQVEGTTSPSGAVAFPNLPASSNASYDLLIVPATLSARATTTTVLALPVPSGGSIQTVQLQAQIGINGQLLAPNSLPAPLDFSSVTIRTYDQSADSPESQTATAVRTDGSFSVFVTPGRSYVLLAVPPTDSGAARTFVGPGPMQASEFTVTQKLMASIMWKGTVRTSDPRNSSLPKIPIPGTVLQIRCLGGPKAWPYCFDGTAALAETTSDANGAFQFALADPSTR